MARVIPFLLHNLMLVHTRNECDVGLFKMNLTGTVDIEDGEDLAVELLRQRIIHGGQTPNLVHVADR